jgi:hypothetical protein
LLRRSKIMIKQFKHFKISWLWRSRVKHIAIISCKFTALQLRVLLFLAIPVLENTDWQKHGLFEDEKHLRAELRKYHCFKSSLAVSCSAGVLSCSPPLTSVQLTLPWSPQRYLTIDTSSLVFFPALDSVVPASTTFPPKILTNSFPSFFLEPFFLLVTPQTLFSEM